MTRAVGGDEPAPQADDAARQVGLPLRRRPGDQHGGPAVAVPLGLELRTAEVREPVVLPSAIACNPEACVTRLMAPATSASAPGGPVPETT
ncbi:hypothetical protein GCM10025868_22320 [Angustibacter aerolatus]|uniref:Uncharacterized protein n=1 Tax=Angustibacter aerolatus TaxID=1162965 RepID=A0ABQ6JFK6_9ACTN|nr:hypothetical protein GCM10025868_22320 [Angustibacter aerolatus]